MACTHRSSAGREADSAQKTKEWFVALGREPRKLAQPLQLMQEQRDPLRSHEAAERCGARQLSSGCAHSALMWRGGRSRHALIQQIHGQLQCGPRRRWTGSDERGGGWRREMAAKLIDFLLAQQ